MEVRELRDLRSKPQAPREGKSAEEAKEWFQKEVRLQERAARCSELSSASTLMMLCPMVRAAILELQLSALPARTALTAWQVNTPTHLPTRRLHI